MTVVTGWKFGHKLVAALGLTDKYVRDIVIKAPINGAVTVQVEILVQDEVAEEIYSICKEYELKEKE